MLYNLNEIIIPLVIILVPLLILRRLMLKRIAIYHSPFLGKIEVFEKYNGEKLLTINNFAQAVSIEDASIIRSYWYTVANDTGKFCQSKKSPRVLMLGLGGNTISSLIAQKNPKIHQTIVEIDPFIIQACKDHFNLNSLPNYELIQADAYKLLLKQNAFVKKFNVIIVDIFTGKPPYVSLKSNQPSFITQLLTYLNKDGLIIFNRPGNIPEAYLDSLKLKSYLQTVFKKTRLIDIQDPRGYRNNIVTGEKLK